MLDVKPLTDELIDSFDRNLRRDPLTNVFHILDLHDPRERKRSEFYVALRDDEIEGKLRVYHGLGIASVWIRGSEEAALRLLEAVKIPNQAVFQVDHELSDLIRREFSITAEYPTEVMVLKRDEQRFFIEHDVEELREEHAIDYLRLFRGYHPSVGAIKEEEIRKFRRGLKRRNVYGIFVDGSLVSTTFLAQFPTLEGVRWIGFTFTKEKHRGRRFATSLVSKAVSDAFQNPGVRHVGLIVRSTNLPAKHVYGKVGFRKHRELAWLSLNTDMAP